MRKIALLFFVVCALSACSTLWRSAPELPIAIGETFELHNYSTGGVSNQGDANNPLSVSNGKATFKYGDLCELSPEHHHFVTVVAFSSDMILLKYTGDHPDPNAENRNCFDGILFDISPETFNMIRERHFDFLKNQKK